MNKYKIGVIGVGVWGCHSLERELLNTGLCDLKSICGGSKFGKGAYDDALAGAIRYAEELNAEFVDSPEMIINDPEIDIISVMTAPLVKAEWIIKALDNNKYVVTDKPLGMTVEDVRLICEAEEASKAHGLMLAGYHTRPAVTKLIELINNGELGEVKSVSIRLNFTGGIFPGFTPTEQWGNEIPGGESVTIGSHGIITAMKLINAPVSEVFQIRKNNFYKQYHSAGVDDYAVFNMKFNNGAVANVSVGRLPYKIPNEDIIIELTGTEGYALLEGTQLRFFPNNIVFDESLDVPQLLKGVFTQFIQSMRDKDIKPAVSFRDGLELQKIISNYEK